MLTSTIDEVGYPGRGNVSLSGRNCAGQVTADENNGIRWPSPLAQGSLWAYRIRCLPRLHQPQHTGLIAPDQQAPGGGERDDIRIVVLIDIEDEKTARFRSPSEND